MWKPCSIGSEYTEILEFLDLRAQAFETSLSSANKKPPRKSDPPVTAFTANSETSGHCILCSTARHPLYVCLKFKFMSHTDMMSTIRRNNLCINSLNERHTVKDCKSSHRCKRCQRPHHTLLTLTQVIQVHLLPLLLPLLPLHLRYLPTLPSNYGQVLF